MVQMEIEGWKKPAPDKTRPEWRLRRQARHRAGPSSKADGVFGQLPLDHGDAGSGDRPVLRSQPSSGSVGGNSLNRPSQVSCMVLTASRRMRR